MLREWRILWAVGLRVLEVVLSGGMDISKEERLCVSRSSDVVPNL